MKNGFVKIRTGIEEHLVRGRLGFFELGVYTTLHLQADYRTGIWIGSAPRLLATAPRGTDLRAVQRAIQRLVDVEFIRTFHIPGARGNYHCLIHKYEPVFGALKGTRLNALRSISWQRPVYEPVAEDDAERDTELAAERDAERAPSQELEVRGKSKKAEEEAAAAAFSAFGFDSPFGHPAFRAAVVRRSFELKNGSNTTEVMELVIEDLQRKVPTQWFRAKHALENSDVRGEVRVGVNNSEPSARSTPCDPQRAEQIESAIAEARRTHRNVNDILREQKAAPL